MPPQAGVSATVVDARFCKPLDTEMLRRLAREHPVMITVEEGSIGGFAAHVMQVCVEGAVGGGGCQLWWRRLPAVLVQVLGGWRRGWLVESRAGKLAHPHCLNAPQRVAPPRPQFLCLEGLMDGGLKFRPMTLPDRYIEHGTQARFWGGVHAACILSC